MAADTTAAKPEMRGVIVSSSGEHFDLGIPGTGHSEWLTIGDTFAGWKLVDYREAEGLLTLTRDGAQIKLSLAPSHIEESKTVRVRGKWSAAFLITKDGTINLNGSAVPVDQLQSVLVQIHEMNPDLPVRINAGETNDADKIRFLMDSIAKAGITRADLVNPNEVLKAKLGIPSPPGSG